MSHKPKRQFPDDLSQVYSRLNQLDVEQFYTGYQWWITHRRINVLQEEIDTLRLQIDENAQYMQHARPPAVALATLARLQANGVDDLDLLDRMLEQGEEDVQEQVAEAAELEATLATEAEDAVDLLTSPMMQESEQQSVELATVPEVSL